MKEIKNDNNSNILYQTKDISLLCDNDILILVANNNIYKLSSYPYEPSLNIKLNNGIITIHNFFNISDIIEVAKENKTLKSITNNEYIIEKICNLLFCAINNNLLDTDISYLEKLLENDKLIELTSDPFYKEYEKYPECVLDYSIIKNNSSYKGIETHKEAVILSMEKWKKVLKAEYDLDIIYNKEKMKAFKIDSKSFFKEDLNDNSYYYFFKETPHGTSYNINDFNKINNMLFPYGKDNLQIYEWSTDWSNYFDEGLEWWGARCVSIYDNNLNRFIVIGASATD